MNNTHKNASKTIALFLSLGLMSSLVACETGDQEEGGEGGDAPTEQPASPDEGGEGGEDG
ncbi:hypothetical protein [Pleurocapsa sp. FMAR1]|uniref:hypothetical protein n=1 Tax=Pleurocapsa sp. FMAR1 TaxID=3040204 RepID=UPI0029C8CCD4|nr:hypothetical protein [Pleurocapsa sp. FMAR1]